MTLAELAAHLGVRTPSLYNHIAGQEGLRRELALLGTRELATRLSRAAIGKAKDDAILAMAHAYRSFAKERLGLSPATLRAPDPGDDERRARGEEILAILSAVLQAYGLRGRGSGLCAPGPTEGAAWVCVAGTARRLWPSARRRRELRPSRAHV